MEDFTRLGRQRPEAESMQSQSWNRCRIGGRPPFDPFDDRHPVGLHQILLESGPGHVASGREAVKIEMMNGPPTALILVQQGKRW